MSPDEWESLCDGCARCCLIKLEDVDTDELVFTSVACHLLDQGTCRCTNYPERSRLVPTCIKVTADNAGAIRWMPPTCAYRMLAEGNYLWRRGDDGCRPGAGLDSRRSLPIKSLRARWPQA